MRLTDGTKGYIETYSTHIARWYYHYCYIKLCCFENDILTVNCTLNMTNTQYSVFGEIWHNICNYSTVGMDNTMVTTHMHIYSHTGIHIHHTHRCAHAHACTHSLPMGVDGAMVTCGLNIPEEDTHSYNHSKKVSTQHI